jgi:hypothetical protein
MYPGWEGEVEDPGPGAGDLHILQPLVQPEDEGGQVHHHPEHAPLDIWVSSRHADPDSFNPRPDSSREYYNGGWMVVMKSLRKYTVQ